LDRQLKAQKAARQAADEEIDAKMAFDLSIVDRQELLGEQGKPGGITKDEAIRQRAVIRAGAKGRKFQNEQQGRNDEIETAQKKLEENNAAIEEAERLAREAEAAIVSEDELKKRKASLMAKHQKEVTHWEKNLEALRASPWDYSNPEINEKPGPRTESDMARISNKISERILAARAARDIAEAEFDQQNPSTEIAGSKKRALDARSKATETRTQLHAKNSDLEFVIDALKAEGAAAAKHYQVQARTAAVVAGTEHLAASPNTRPNRIQDDVLNATGAFPGPISNLGNSVSQNSSEFNEVMAEALKSYRAQNQLFRATKDEWIQLRQDVKELQMQFRKSPTR
jgi:hypothetical protein